MIASNCLKYPWFWKKLKINLYLYKTIFLNTPRLLCPVISFSLRDTADELGVQGSPLYLLSLTLSSFTLGSDFFFFFLLCLHLRNVLWYISLKITIYIRLLNTCFLSFSKVTFNLAFYYVEKSWWYKISILSSPSSAVVICPKDVSEKLFLNLSQYLGMSHLYLFSSRGYKHRQVHSSLRNCWQKVLPPGGTEVVRFHSASQALYIPDKIKVT